jgi:hypothetical protein
MKNVHDNIKPHVCPFCEYMTANKSSLEKHVRTG